MKNFKFFIFVLSAFCLNQTLFSMETENKDMLKISPKVYLSPIGKSSSRGSTPLNAHLSSNVKEFLTTPDETKINEVTIESTCNLLKQELKKFFYKEFVSETITQDNFPVYDDMCEKLATAAIYADVTYHRPSLNLRLAFRKNRSAAREMIIEVRNQTEKNSWLNIAATLELMKIDALGCEKLGNAKFNFITENPAQIDRLMRLCNQNINIKTKIDAYKLFIKCYLPYCNSNPQIIAQVALAISFLIEYCKPNTIESKFHFGLISLINNINNQISNTYLTQYQKQESETLKCLREEGFELREMSKKQKTEHNIESPQKISPIEKKTEENITN